MKKLLLIGLVGANVLCCTPTMIHASELATDEGSVQQNMIVESEDDNLANEPSLAYVGTTTTHSYSFTKGSTGTEYGSWTNFYIGAPATETNEVDTINQTFSYQHTFSGTIAGNLKKDIQVSLGYSFGVSESFSVSRSSRPLKKGEYVKGYFRRTYSTTNIRQCDAARTTGFELQPGGGGVYEPVDRTSYTYSTLVAKKAIAPQLKLEYYTSNSKSSFAAICNYESEADGLLTKVEIYDLVDGEYVLTSVEEMN